MKKTLIIANWKMNPKTTKEANNLFNSIKDWSHKIKKAEVVICPPFIYLPFLKEKGRLKLGGQNGFWEESGAYTGEVSLLMLKKIGVEYVIIGHSERRKYFKETNSEVLKKTKAALSFGLKPIICVDKVSQIPDFSKFRKEEIKNIIIAYEPLFAIGTGKACSPKKAKEKRLLIKHDFVLYGGSVNFKNARDYLLEAGFQGLLVGGASLKAKDFIKIIDSVEKN